MNDIKFNGKYIAEVEGVTDIKVVGVNATPSISIKFAVKEERTPLGDIELNEFEKASVWKNYYLTDKTIPYVRKELYSAFKFESDILDLKDIVGIKCELVLQVNDKGYNEVKFVNSLNSPKKESTPESVISKVSELWNMAKR